jgi:hypothetical protein
LHFPLVGKRECLTLKAECRIKKYLATIEANTFIYGNSAEFTVIELPTAEAWLSSYYSSEI